MAGRPPGARKFAIEMQKKRQEERLARQLSSDFDSKVSKLEEKMANTLEATAGLEAARDDIIESNKRLTDQVISMMDSVKMKEKSNTTKRKLDKLREKYGKK